MVQAIEQSAVYDSYPFRLPTHSTNSAEATAHASRHSGDCSADVSAGLNSSKHRADDAS